jgi:hypothetical protein
MPDEIGFPFPQIFAGKSARVLPAAIPAKDMATSAEGHACKSEVKASAALI